MKIIDLNILIYAVNENSVHHQKSKEWLEQQLNGSEAIGLPWIVLLGFLRIMTNMNIFPNALSTEQVIGIIDIWLDHPLVSTPGPGRNHWNLVKELLAETGTAGNLTSDVHLAAIAISNGAKVMTLDADFSRFQGLRWDRPF